tara:strand:- start:429 stop:623 length:195 start_codon:yes stop_codon:yes gene_type:complete
MQYSSNISTLQRIAWEMKEKMWNLWEEEPRSVAEKNPRYLGRPDRKRGLTPQKRAARKRKKRAR